MAQSIVKRGSVVLIRYPFTDLTGAKVRPALVLTPDHLLLRLNDVLCLFISSALPDAATQELRALLLRRRQVVDMLTAERNRLGTVPPRIHQAIQQHIAWLEGQLRSLDDDLTQAIQRSAVGQATAAILQSIPGVGPVLSRTLLGQVPE